MSVREKQLAARKASVQAIVTEPTVAVATGNGIVYFTIPDTLDGLKLKRAQATVVTAGSGGGTTDVMIHNLTSAVDMLTAAISIASGATIGTVGTIDGANNGVLTDDIIRIDVDSISGTSALGLMVILTFGPA